MIELKNLERSYKTGHTETWVLRRINLTIREGEFMTVMGPSGAGKSSLLNVLAMLDDQWRGEFYFADHAVHAMNRKQRAELARRRIGMVFQSYHLLDDLTVAENIDLPLSYKDIPKAERQARRVSQARPWKYATSRSSTAASAGPETTTSRAPCSRARAATRACGTNSGVAARRGAPTSVTKFFSPSDDETVTARTPPRCQSASSGAGSVFAGARR